MTDRRNYLLDPLFASCPAPGCTEWQPLADNEAHKARIEAAHRQRLHPHTVESVTDLVGNDPRHEIERREVEAAILVAGRANGGRVSANVVRPLLPSWVTPQLVGAVFAGMSKPGGPLIPVARVPSTDTRGRNTNKDHNEYLLRDVWPQGVAS